MNKHIDHTNLKPIAIETDIIQLCDEAKKYNFRAVCVNPCWVSLAVKQLKDSGIKVATVIGFPLGANCSQIKQYETTVAIAHGAREIDIVWNLGWFKEGKYLAIVGELTRIVNHCLFSGVLVKVIVETCYLDTYEIIKAHQIVKDSGAQYIKTSTGFGPEGAILSDIAHWKHLGYLKIKASGGIKTYQQAKEFIDAGADVLGTSHGVGIVEEEEKFEIESDNPAPGCQFCKPKE